MITLRAIGKVLDAFRRLRIWQRVLVVYAISVPLSWLLWQWQVPDRRPGSHLMFSFVIGPIAIAALVGIGMLIGRAFDERP